MTRPFAFLALSAVCACAHAPSAPPASSFAYVSNEGSNDISILDRRSDELVATIPVGLRPRGIRTSPDGRWLYVALSGSPLSAPGEPRPVARRNAKADGIAVIDVTTRKVVRVLPGGADPETFDLSPDGHRIYVSNEEDASASVVDVAAGKVIATAPVGEEPEGVAARPDGAAIYVTSKRESKVTVLGPTGQVLAQFATGARPRNVVFSPDGVLAFVSAEEGASVTVVDARRHRPISTIPIDAPGAKPMGLAASLDGTRVYVSNGRGATISMIDVAAQKVVASFPSGGRWSWGIAVTRDGKKLYVANGLSDDVSVLDAHSGALLTRIRVGSRPWGIALGR